MAAGYSRLRAALRATADALGGLFKIVLGTPGSYVQYPAAGTPESEARETGSAWVGYLLPFLLAEIGKDIDSVWAPWCHTWTNTAGNPPNINDHTGIASVTKDEVANTITVTLSPVMVNNRYTVVARVENQVFVDEVTAISASSFTIRFSDTAAAVQNINNRMVMIQIRGQA